VPDSVAGAVAEIVKAAEIVRIFAYHMEAATNFILNTLTLQDVVPSAILKFVEALNPGLINAFMWQLRNVAATVGYAFEPLVAQVATTARELGGLLLPMMRELRPVIAAVSETLSGIFLVTVRAVVGIVIALTNVFKYQLQAVLILTNALVDVLESLMIFRELVFDIIGEMLKEAGILKDVNDLMTEFKSAVAKCAAGMIILLGGMLKVAGFADTLTRFRERMTARLRERREGVPGGLAAAPKDVGTSGIEDIARKLSERAFQAQSGVVATRSDNEILEEIVQALDTLENVDLKSVIREGVKEGMIAAKDAATDNIFGFETINDISSNPLVADQLRAAFHAVTDGPLFSLQSWYDRF
jgi:hypothetical protein